MNTGLHDRTNRRQPDGSPDTFRIKSWYENGGEVLVYDNGFDQAIGGGSIVVHTK